MKILYLSCHSILEYEEVLLLHEMGHEVFSPGAYVEPANPGDSTLRPDIPGLVYDPEILDLWHKHEAKHPAIGGKEYLSESPELINKFDCVIVMHYPDFIIKNWSSLIMFNCGHSENRKLTPEVVNTQTGRWLHGFGWLPDKEADIGRIPEEWNWLDGHSPEDMDAKNVHFTTGGPWFKDWRPRGEVEGKYAVEWCNDAEYLKLKGIINMDRDYMI